MSSHNLCILIPIFDHAQAIVAVCDELKPLGLPILLVDDGSHRECAETLNRIAANRRHVHLIRLVQNSGKGVALRVGMAEAQRLGYTHALTIDADGQHDVKDLSALVERSRAEPTFMVVGTPVYEDGVSWPRRYRRALTKLIVRLSCLSRDVRHGACGVRVYPLGPINRLLSRIRCGDRMEFDTAVLVRWRWRGGRCDNLPVHVRGAYDGVSHYRLLRDNLRLMWMFLRLLIGMVLRLPWLLKQRRVERQARKAMAT